MKIWSFRVPSEVQLFLWKLEHNVLPTASFQSHRLSIAISSNCKWCNQSIETSNHLFESVQQQRISGNRVQIGGVWTIGELHCCIEISGKLGKSSMGLSSKISGM